MAEKIGRNAPCPCGSGKKYKQCCLYTDQQPVLDVKAKIQAAHAAVAQALEWAKRKTWVDLRDQVLTEHLSIFFEDGDEGLDEVLELLAPEILEFVFPFAMEDFLSSRFEPDGSNVIDEFLNRKGTSLPPFGRNYLEALRDSFPGLYEVAETTPGHSVTLRDLLRGNTVTVSEELGSNELEASQFIACRLLDVEGTIAMGGGVYVFPRDVVLAMVEEFQKACRENEQEFKSVQQDSGDLLLDLILANATPLISALWLSSVAAHFCETEEPPSDDDGDTDHCLLLKVVLSDRQGRVRGRPYRMLSVPPGASLYELAQSITDAFDFDFDHAFGFYDNIKNPYRSREGYELFADMGEHSRHQGVEKTTVGSVFRQLKQKMLFLFDYGDEWRFVVQLTGVEPLQSKASIAVVEEQGEAPLQYESDWDEE